MARISSADLAGIQQRMNAPTLSQQVGSDFEQEIAPSFAAYAQASLAWLAFMPLPMYPTHIRHPATGQILYARKGRAPFDVYGYTAKGVMVGAEIKANSDPHNALSIVKPDADGTGLQYHQLDALANLATHGGIARVIWCNAGQVGVLENDCLLAAHAVYMTSLEAELAGNRPAKGTRSIPWTQFKPVPLRPVAGLPIHDWLEVK
jgi:penicillin-binding protein-related factor A (putative recombinase)